MRHGSVLFVTGIVLVAHVGRAQPIPVTVATAQAEAAAFPHDPTPVM